MVTVAAVRQAGIGLLAGVIVGFPILGIGGRIAMSIVAVARGQQPDFSVSGTLGVFVVLTLLAAPAGLLFVALKRHMPGTGLWKGLSFGVLFFLIIAAMTFLRRAGMGELAGDAVIGGTLFGALIVLYGIAVATVEERIDRYMPAPRRNLTSILGYGVLGVVGALGVFLYVAFMV